MIYHMAVNHPICTNKTDDKPIIILKNKIWSTFLCGPTYRQIEKDSHYVQKKKQRTLDLAAACKPGS